MANFGCVEIFIFVILFIRINCDTEFTVIQPSGNVVAQISIPDDILIYSVEAFKSQIFTKSRIKTSEQELMIDMIILNDEDDILGFKREDNEPIIVTLVRSRQISKVDINGVIFYALNRRNIGNSIADNEQAAVYGFINVDSSFTIGDIKQKVIRQSSPVGLGPFEFKIMCKLEEGWIFLDNFDETVYQNNCDPNENEIFWGLRTLRFDSFEITEQEWMRLLDEYHVYYNNLRFSNTMYPVKVAVVIILILIVILFIHPV